MASGPSPLKAPPCDGAPPFVVKRPGLGEPMKGLFPAGLSWLWFFCGESWPVTHYLLGASVLEAQIRLFSQEVI